MRGHLARATALLGGFAGAWLLALAGSDLLSGRPVRWWFTLHLPGASVLVYVGLALLCAGWLALGWTGASRRWLLLATGLWALPLALGPALFSRDLYSYLAQGTLVHLGLDPYRHGPAALGHGPVLAAVSPFWRHTVAPYGPAFLWLASLAAAAVGAHVVLGALLLRIPELLGVALLATFVPRLARSLGADPRRALWLVVPAPLTLVELVGAGHNDALMTGLVLAGVAFAVERRWAPAIGLCALAALVKLPALAAVAFVAVAWLRDDPARGGRILATCASICVGVAVLVSWASGLGTSWVSSGFLSSPAKLHLAVTPATQLGWVAAHALGVAARPLEDGAVAVTLAAAAVAGLCLLWRVRRATLVPCLAAFLLVLAAAGPAFWPWYLVWGLALLAAWQSAVASPLMIVAVSLPVFLFHAGGQLILPRSAAPWVLLFYLAMAVYTLRVAPRARKALAPSAQPRRRAPVAPLP